MPRPHPGWEDRVRDGFARQEVMATLSARIAELSPGRAVLEMPYAREFTQQHGYLHAGMTATLADSACGYAAFTLAPAGYTVLTVEFKINLVAPARGQLFVADGRLLRAGKTLSVCTSTVTAHDLTGQTDVAYVQATISMRPGSDGPGLRNLRHRTEL